VHDKDKPGPPSFILKEDLDGENVWPVTDDDVDLPRYLTYLKDSIYKHERGKLFANTEDPRSLFIDGFDDVHRPTEECTCFQRETEDPTLVLFTMKRPVQRVGVMARKDFKKGEYVGDYVGRIVIAMPHVTEPVSEAPETRLLGHWNKKTKFPPGEKPRKYYFDSSDECNETRFIYHLCDPSVINCKIVPENHKGMIRQCIKATKDIVAGQQVLLEYFPATAWKSANASCRCGWEGCKYQQLKTTRDPEMLTHLAFPPRDNNNNGPQKRPEPRKQPGKLDSNRFAGILTLETGCLMESHWLERWELYRTPTPIEKSRRVLIMDNRARVPRRVVQVVFNFNMATHFKRDTQPRERPIPKPIKLPPHRVILQRTSGQTPATPVASFEDARRYPGLPPGYRLKVVFYGRPLETKAETEVSWYSEEPAFPSPTRTTNIWRRCHCARNILWKVDRRLKLSETIRDLDVDPEWLMTPYYWIPRLKRDTLGQTVRGWMGLTEECTINGYPWHRPWRSAPEDPDFRWRGGGSPMGAEE
jgi:hypothetical protein